MHDERVQETDAHRAIEDVHRRVRNILDVYPATTWDLAEATEVLAALESIVRGRQAMGDVIAFPRGKPSG